jgi:hypothetical protein
MDGNKLHSILPPINQYGLVQNVATISYNLSDIPANYRACRQVLAVHAVKRFGEERSCLQPLTSVPDGDQPHAPAALPLEKELPVPTVQEAGSAVFWGGGNLSLSQFEPRTVQPVAQQLHRHYLALYMNTQFVSCTFNFNPLHSFL